MNNVNKIRKLKEREYVDHWIERLELNKKSKRVCAIEEVAYAGQAKTDALVDAITKIIDEAYDNGKYSIDGFNVKRSTFYNRSMNNIIPTKKKLLEIYASVGVRNKPEFVSLCAEIRDLLTDKAKAGDRSPIKVKVPTGFGNALSEDLSDACLPWRRLEMTDDGWFFEIGF